MKNPPIRLSVLLLGVGTVSSPAALTGKVTMPDGAAVPGITVVQKSTGLSALTDAQGAYQIGTTTGLAATGEVGSSLVQSGRLVQLTLGSAAFVEITVRDVRGQILSRDANRLEAGRWNLDPLAGIAGSGMALVEIRAGDVHRTFSLLRAPGLSRGVVSGGVASGLLARAEAAADTLTLKDGATVIGKVGVPSSTGTAPDAKIVRRTFTGKLSNSDTALTATKGSLKLELEPSIGSKQTVPLVFAAAAGTFSASTPWKLHESGLTWKATARAFDGNGTVIGSSSRRGFTDSVKSVALDTFSVIPDGLKPAVDWVWINRIKKDNALDFYNSIHDQIIAKGGKLNYVVRWESKTRITKEQRVKFEPMLNRAITSWVKYLKGYDRFPYDSVPVKIVGWAVSNVAYLDTTGLKVPVYVNGGLESEGAAAPKGPDVCNRDEFHDRGTVTTTFPDCKAPNQPYEMNLWGTDGMNGGAGGDWGQRVGSAYILSVLDAAEPHIISHEIGHGFMLPDFYEPQDLPPTGLPTAIMRAGNSAVVTPWDGWMLRRVWSELVKQGRWTLP
jgi:hypothetical protein